MQVTHIKENVYYYHVYLFIYVFCSDRLHQDCMLLFDPYVVPSKRMQGKMTAPETLIKPKDKKKFLRLKNNDWKGEKEERTRGSTGTHQKLLSNGQAFTHWTNIFQFISMTKDTIILDMPECNFH